MKEEKKHVGRPTNEELAERKGKKVRKIVLSLIIGIAAVFALISIASVIFANNNTVKLGKVATIETDEIKITVLKSENVTIDEGELSLINGDYTKVKIKLENYGKEAYKWGLLNFYLGNKSIALPTLVQPDLLKEEIAAGETVTGYIYFEQTSETVLEYISSAVVIDENTAASERVYFKIK